MTTTTELPRLSVREHGRSPAIGVHDRIVWAREGGDVATAYAELDQGTIEALYRECFETFWREANDLAITAGYTGGVYQDGRSGGWLIPGGRHYWLDYTVTNADGFDTSAGEYHPERAPLWIPPLGQDPNETDADREEYGAAIAQRERFMGFAREIAQLQTATENLFRERLREAVADLNARREACIVRGEN